jgi:peptidyl-tRNA hydrolase, PTH1 family
LKVILGLGNPGREYEHTRHNVGWWVLDHLADVWRLDGWRRDGETLTRAGTFANQAVRLVKPLTYMNLSGQALRPYLRRPSWSAASDLMVVVDEVAIPLGTYRLRARGSAGGHNGLRDLESTLGTQVYPRLRVGIKPLDDRRIGDLAGFVLSPFSSDERPVVLELLPRLQDAIEIWLRDGIIKAMNIHNGDGKAKPA